MTARDAGDVARGLTKAQREFLAGKLPHLSITSKGSIIHALKHLGIYEVRYDLTDLGLAVRAHLEKRNA